MQASALCRHIVLAGFMGSGKSTLARGLAGRLGSVYHDLDAVIEQRQGMSVRSIFQRSGEAQFRTLERRELARLLEHEPMVLALGGGALVDSQNRERIAAHGLLVYLKVPAHVLALRLANSTDRPLLLGRDGQVLPVCELTQRIESLLEEREPLYMQADMVFEVAPSWNPEQTLEHLQAALPRTVFKQGNRSGTVSGKSGQKGLCSPVIPHPEPGRSTTPEDTHH